MDPVVDDMMFDFYAFIFCVFLFLVVSFFAALYAYFTRRKVTFVVREKGTLTHGYTNNGRGSTYTNFMIYTRDDRAFKNVNSLWYWKWRSTELQAKIRVGKKYVADIYGWRIGAFNVYPNIIRVREIKPNKK